MRDDITVNTNDNRWEVQGSATVTPISMALRTTMYAGTDCDPSMFSIHYDALHTTTEGDGAIIISAGSEYLSFMFDFDGFVWIGGPTATYQDGGSGIYPACGSNTLPQFPNSATDSSSLFDDSQDTYNAGSDDSFWNWRDRMAGGDRRNWNVFNSAAVGNQAGGFTVSFQMDETSMTVSFNAGAYVASCTINSVFSFDNGNDVVVDFSPDYDGSEYWWINSITVTTDCIADTPPPTNYPTKWWTSPPTKSPIPPTPKPTWSPTPKPTPRPTWRPTPRPTWRPTPKPTFCDERKYQVGYICRDHIKCDNSPCSCYGNDYDSNCLVCHDGQGCSQCSNDHFN